MPSQRKRKKTSAQTKLETPGSTIGTGVHSARRRSPLRPGRWLRSRAALTATSTSSATFSAPNSVGVGLDPPLGLLDDDAAAEPCRRRRPTRSSSSGRTVPTSVRSPWTLSRPIVGGLHRGRAELDVRPLQDLVVDRLLDVRLVDVAERLHPAEAFVHAKRRGVGLEHDARLRRILADLERRLPGGDLDQEVVSGLGRGAGAPGPDPEGAVLGPERVRACGDPHRVGRDSRRLR